MFDIRIRVALQEHGHNPVKSSVARRAYVLGCCDEFKVVEEFILLPRYQEWLRVFASCFCSSWPASCRVCLRSAGFIAFKPGTHTHEKALYFPVKCQKKKPVLSGWTHSSILTVKIIHKKLPLREHHKRVRKNFISASALYYTREWHSHPILGIKRNLSSHLTLSNYVFSRENQHRQWSDSIHVYKESHQRRSITICVA